MRQAGRVSQRGLALCGPRWALVASPFRGSLSPHPHQKVAKQLPDVDTSDQPAAPPARREAAWNQAKWRPICKATGMKRTSYQRGGSLLPALPGSVPASPHSAHSLNGARSPFHSQYFSTARRSQSPGSSPEPPAGDKSLPRTLPKPGGISQGSADRPQRSAVAGVPRQRQDWKRNAAGCLHRF